MATPPNDGLIGTVVDGRYRILRRLGHGGMGSVYEVDHERIGRRFALKTLHAELAKDAEMVARFHREARAAGAIGNEHIIEVSDMGRLDDSAAQIDSAHDHTCAVRDDERIVCWGVNATGQLGDGSMVSFAAEPVTVFGVDNADEVTTGYSHTCARRADGRLSCWGRNRFGGLGNGSTETSSTPVYVGSP